MKKPASPFASRQRSTEKSSDRLQRDLRCRAHDALTAGFRARVHREKAPRSRSDFTLSDLTDYVTPRVDAARRERMIHFSREW
jgi:hypothetical protein